MQHLTIILLIFFIAFAAACGSSAGGGEAKPNAEQNANTATKPADSKSAETKPADAPDKASLTGVAACDEYLSKVEVCLNKPNVPEATKAAYRQSLEQNRAAWKRAASSAQGKASLEASCKMAIDSAKPFFDGCK